MTDQPDHTLPMVCSSSIAALVASLAKAQGAFPDVEKGKRAHIATKAGGHFSYQYADLATILAAVRKPLADNELAILQPVQVSGNRVSVTTVLAHASGEWVASDLALPIGDPTDARSLASALTYGRRYGVIALLGIAPRDEDDDAAAAVTPEARTAKPSRAASPVAQSVPTETAVPAADTAFITDKQRKRLFAIKTEKGWSDQDLKAWLIKEGIGSTSKIAAREYDAVVTLLRASDRPTSTVSSPDPSDAA
jgi:ERF superfamily